MRSIRAHRWSDNDAYFGPFTFSRDNHRHLTALLDSGHDEYPGCHLRLQALWWTLIISLPAVIKPYRRWVDTSGYQWSSGPGSGYWEEHAREYGFSLSEGFLQVRFGRQTDSSNTTQDWCCFLPWTQWRHIRFTLCDLDGAEFWTQRDGPSRKGIDWFKEKLEFEDLCPKAMFRFRDFDGQEIEATTHIEEREWRFGTGWFKWLSWFRAPRISRCLSLKFSAEVGREKGSWKGGMVGHAIEMRLAETPSDAFMRYCVEHELEYIGQIAA